jgi:hypothetical protein
VNPAVLSWALARPADDLWRKLAVAYASGVTRVRHDGKEVEYRSITEIASILSTAYGAENTQARRPAFTVARPLDARR